MRTVEPEQAPGEGASAGDASNASTASGSVLGDAQSIGPQDHVAVAMEAALAIIKAETSEELLDEVVRRALALIGAEHGMGRLDAGQDLAEPTVRQAGELAAKRTIDAAGAPGQVLSVPLLAPDGRALGSIELSGKAGGFAPDDARLLAQLAGFASTALGNLRLYHAMAEAQAQREAFFGILSHELRTPITTIYGGTRMLVQADGRLSHDARREVQLDIATDAERLYRLIEDLLVLTRSEHGSLDVAPEPVLLQRLLPRVLESERQRWPAVRFRSELPPALPAVVGEETYVEQIVRNLLNNAGKYAGTSGEVLLTVEAEPTEVILRVLDEGPGLGDQSPDQLFELFYRAEEATRRASGAGIGLYACRELVRAMGGRIWARPRAVRGAEFGFALRIFDEET